MKHINVIDIEASGLHFDAYPIEVAVLINEKVYSWLIKPEPNWLHWCSAAESMHGITRERLLSEGLNAAQVAEELNNLLKHSDAPLCSDAVYWDSDWIDTLFHSVKQSRLFHISSLYELMNEDECKSFDHLKRQLALSGKYRQHRAKEDVRLILDAYYEASSGL
ncbi:hypothetical protein [Litoribacillus peritrichatus]|uniref:Exonuclease domain-containing protein n=1 Tax=Litoribacillus peritrichatus TaxID=718191 RepID=A0ABP7ML86_9GAMM